ncbi:hypothetical protein [Clostridium polynesiense]|uniref:hypothetical protein n=1 Tax=Clostridium polynesiense TaxID=1325933 RepID=UPI00058EA694|nr:hypothetical protein [Clostridium polynesiense]
MEQLIIGTLNVNQLGVPSGVTVENASNEIYKNLELLLAYVREFFFCYSNQKVLILHEMKYKSSSRITGGYKEFERVLNNEGYKILKNNVSSIQDTVSFITLAITKNKDVKLNSHSIFTHNKIARYVELKYKDYTLLGVHQSIDSEQKQKPLNLDVFRKTCKNKFVILGDLNVNLYKMGIKKKEDLSENEVQYYKLVNDNVIDVFGNSIIPTFAGGSRIDYILVSSDIVSAISEQRQDNSTRIGGKLFTDHSLLSITLNIE